MKKFFGILGMVIAGIGICFLVSLAMMWLWNWLMPEIFHLPEITYWQTLGLFILSRFLFGGVHLDKKNPHKKIKEREEWKRKFREKLESIDKDKRDTIGKIQEDVYKDVSGKVKSLYLCKNK